MEAEVSKLKSFVKNFYQTYYHKQYDKLVDMFDEQGVWSGFHIEKGAVGKEAINTLLKHIEEDQANTDLVISRLEIDIIPIKTQLYIANSTYWLKPRVETSQATSIPIYSSMLLELQEEPKILQVFFSLFGNKIDYHSDFVQSLQEMDVHKMRMTLIEHARQLEEADQEVKSLYNTVPGGIFKCLYDENLTLLETSDGFLNMIGYTREEIHELLDDSLRRLIYPSDFVETLQEVERQMQISNMKELQYRLMCKNGKLINILDKGQLFEDEYGQKCFHCIVVDVTREKQIEEELKLTLERFQIITNQTNDVVFEWDIKKDKVMISNNWEKKFKQRYWNEDGGLLEVIQGEYSVIFPEDQEMLLDSLEELQAGKQYTEQEVRMRNYEDAYIWFKIRMTAQFDEYHRPFKVIGVIIDIDQEKRHSIKLRKKAEQDALTGTYNKMTTQELIQEELKLQNQEVGALMIIDIDNFKRINDTMGHLYGDAVLSDLSKTILHAFRSEDIVGRIGGDEFMVFMKELDHKQTVIKKAKEMMHSIATLRVASEKQIDVSCSIGISMYPNDGNSFETLYQNADYALYQAKMQGKNQFAFYDEELIHQYLNKQSMPYETTINSKIDSDEANKSGNGEFEEYVFQILYHTENVQDAISMILEIIGIQFDVSRVYIFENSDDDRYCSNTFEWCNVGVEPQINELQYVSYERDLGGNYLSNFNEERLFYCPDITQLPKLQYDVLEPQGIKSMLQCAITDNGEFRGYVGFDENRQTRYWTKVQIDTLTFISQIISTFLLKRRAEEQYHLENESLLSMLDNQHSYIYVIEPITMKLLYVNKATSQIAKKESLGMTCHKAFMDLDHPCEHCPAKMVTPQNQSYFVEFYNQILDVWTDAEASLVKWKRKDAILLSCHDISKFKK